MSYPKNAKNGSKHKFYTKPFKFKKENTKFSRLSKPLDLKKPNKFKNFVQKEYTLNKFKIPKKVLQKLNPTKTYENNKEYKKNDNFSNENSTKNYNLEKINISTNKSFFEKNLNISRISKKSSGTTFVEKESILDSLDNNKIIKNRNFSLNKPYFNNELEIKNPKRPNTRRFNKYYNYNTLKPERVTKGNTRDIISKIFCKNDKDIINKKFETKKKSKGLFVKLNSIDKNKNDNNNNTFFPGLNKIKRVHTEISKPNKKSSSMSDILLKSK